MKRHSFRLGLVFTCLLSLAPGVPAIAGPGERAGEGRFGSGPAYDALGEIPVLHNGRIKPLDTMARLEVRDVYGPGEITLKGESGAKDAKWTAVGALIDWPTRPDFWDGQEIILIDLWDYRGFKQELLAEPIKRSLADLAVRASTTSQAKSAIEALIKQDLLAEKDLDELLRLKLLDESAKAVVEGWARKLSEGRKRVSPAALHAAVLKVDDRRLSFDDWFREVYPKGVEVEQSEGMRKLEPREEFVYVVGKRLSKYEGFRDNMSLVSPQTDIPITPRPYNEAYLKYTGAMIREVIDAANSQHRPEGGSEFDDDVTNALAGYLKTFMKPNDYVVKVIAGKERVPGEDAKFDRSFRNWLREASNWVPLRLIMGADIHELQRAGIPESKVQAFRTAFTSMESAEREAPGRMSVKPALAFASAVRALGESTSPAKYPTANNMQRETHFNRLDPFGKAPFLFGIGLIFLLVSLGVTAQRGSQLWIFDRFLYYGGLAGLVSGIALEVYGFYLRINISGWAPVTNMYETVIWVALGSAVLGLVLELIFRRKFAATAATGTALLATLLAANVSLLEPNIGQLPPVLRDNFWLTVHVLTIVSSYAAFSLVMGLGLLGIAYYLSATYRRDVPYLTAAKPMVWGLPLIVIGLAVHGATRHQSSTSSLTPVEPAWISAGACLAGGFLFVVGLFAAMGEFANRRAKAAAVVGSLVMCAGALAVLGLAEKTPPGWWPSAELPLWFFPGIVTVCGFAQVVLSVLGDRSRRVLVAAEAHSQERVSVSEGWPGAGKEVAGVSVIERVKQASAAAPASDPRGLAIQSTAALVKPLANFIYRAMQVGVLLVALGTFLGGWWADKSWGRFWGWDPKEVWALITLLVYLIPLHGRFAGWVTTFGLVAASVICYNAVLMAWYGVNWVLGVGLHSYGFTEGGGQGMVLVSDLMLAAVVFGAWWRRRMGSRVESPISQTV
jgi:ABC-type transport system involved in cytochrome c biogenesis permease subunit